jgi:(2Fe-2S) ferredoxin/predicted O-methyltransferase YrrM
MEPFSFHLFVCTQQKPEGAPSCPAAGSFQILQALDRELQARGLAGSTQVSTCGCLGLCDEGPMMIVYPEGIWYRRVKPEDVAEIVASHLGAGKPVQRLTWSDAAAMQAMIAEHGERYRAMLKAKDESGALPDDLYETIRGFMPSRALLTALELDVFTAVGQGGSAAEVAGKIHADLRATEMLLNVLVNLRLLEKRDGRFTNTAVSRRYFVEGSRDNARPALLHTANLWRRWSTLTAAVQAGTAVEAGGRDATGTEAFIAAMDHNARERAPHVLRAVGAAGIRRMLDLGGGSGAYSIAFAQANPQLHAEILDMAEVLPLTQEYIRQAGVEGRVTTRAGDMLSARLGAGYDLVLMSAICHMFSPEENQRMFERAFQALGPKGRLVIQDFILEADKTSPRFAALFSLNMLVGTRAGSDYSEPEYADWLRRSGFAEVRRVRLPGPSGLMVAEKS